MVSTKAECIYANVKNYIYYLEKYNSYLLFNPYIHQWLSLNRIGSEIVSALEKHKTIDGAVEELRERFGKRAVTYAVLLGDLKMPGDGRELVRMPGLMYK